MVLTIVLGFIVIMLLWVLLAPLSLRIDTYLNEYQIKWRGIGKVEVLFIPEDVVLHLRIGPYRKDFYALHLIEKEGGKKAPKKAPASEKKRGHKISFHMIRRILKSFTIKEFQLEIDTDNYVWNAWLFPLLYAIKPLRHRVSVNFQGRNGIRLFIENKVWKIAWAALW